MTQDDEQRALDKAILQILNRLAADIRDRKGLGDEWETIDDEVMINELRPAWKKIIKEEIESYLQSKASEGAGDGWQPIETAPKDGTSILLMTNDQPGCPGGVAAKTWCGNTAVAEWWADDSGGGEWICYMSMVKDPELHFEPTHWMPLPKPPETKP